MHQITFIVQVLQSHQHLFSDHFDECLRYTLLLVPLDERQQVFAQWLEDDTNVGSLGAFMAEAIEEGDYVLSARMCRGERGYTR